MPNGGLPVSAGCGDSRSPRARRLVGDPVDVVTGASVDARTEFRLAGPLPFVWRRHSDSARAGRAFALGWGHAHGYERALRFDLDGLRYVGPLGATVTFAAPRADGDRVASGARALCRVDARRYLLQTVGEPDMEFLLPPGGDVAPLAAVAQGGARVEFAYDARGRLAGVLDSARRHIAVGCDEAGRVTHLTLEGGRTSPWRLVAYTYDAAGNLARGVDAYGQEFTFGHDDAHRIVRRTDCRGYAFLFAYDEQGRCVHSRGEDGLHEVWIRYAPEERTTTVVRADGGRWVYRYDEQGTVRSITGPDGGERRFEVDADGAPVAERGPGGTETRLLFDRLPGYRIKEDICLEREGLVGKI